MISIARYSDAGGRNDNEDSCGYIRNEEGGICAVMADGLGGEGQGALASHTAMENILNSFMENQASHPSDLAKWVSRANDKVLEMQTRECAMKTTVVILQITKENAMWAHVGDSRLYHFVDGTYESRTFDHSVSQMSVLRGEITEEEIRRHVDRNRLLKALGRDSDITAELSEVCDLRDGNSHAFLLCTDGFWEYVYEKEMEEGHKASDSAGEWIEGMAEILKRRAKPDNDNNSAIGLIIT